MSFIAFFLVSCTAGNTSYTPSTFPESFVTYEDPILDLNGGTFPDGFARLSRSGNTLSDISAPLKMDGDTAIPFAGWYLDSEDLTSKISFPYELTADNIPFHAHYEYYLLNYYISSQNLYLTTKADLGSEVTSPTLPVDSSYPGVFQGWQYKNADGDYVDFPDGTKIYHDYDLYAKFTSASADTGGIIPADPV